MVNWQIIFYGILGIMLIWIGARRPKWCWPILIFCAVGTAGLMIQGYCLIDEYLIGCIIFGFLLAVFFGTVRLQKEKEDIRRRIHIWTFFIMIVYMIMQSFRGLILWEDWRIIRWIISYTMLGILSFLISIDDFPALSIKKTLLLISWTAILYFALYLGYGLFCEKIRGISRFAMQGIEWSGSSYAMFPLVISLPAAIFLLNDKNYRQYIGWSIWVIVTIVAFYYESRISFLTLLAFIFVSISAIRFRKVIILLLCYLIIFCYFNYCGINLESWVSKVKGHIFMLSQSSSALWAPRHSDIDRILHLKASFSATGSNMGLVLFGHGIHSHRYIMGYFLQPLYAKYLPNAKVKGVARTLGFSALLIDSGWVGVLLLMANFLFSVREIFTNQNLKFKTYRYILLSSLLITFLWLLVSNIQDILLFYLIIMPSGLLVLLSKHHHNTGYNFYGE